VGKFVPGLSTFVIPIAGFSGMRYHDFLRFDSVGILLWATSMLAIGYWSGESINTLLGNVRDSRSALLLLSALFLICFYVIKLWRLKRFGRAEIKEG
jgi:membrane protein DedA with SNARE-associated domain